MCPEVSKQDFILIFLIKKEQLIKTMLYVFNLTRLVEKKNEENSC